MHPRIARGPRRDEPVVRAVRGGPLEGAAVRKLPPRRLRAAALPVLLVGCNFSFNPDVEIDEPDPAEQTSEPAPEAMQERGPALDAANAPAWIATPGENLDGVLRFGPQDGGPCDGGCGFYLVDMCDGGNCSLRSGPACTGCADASRDL